MINLIPNEEKKKMASDFYKRFVVIFLLMLSLCAAIAVLILFPSYFLSLEKESFANKKLETQKSEPIPILDQETLVAIKSLDQKLTLIENTKNNKFIVSQKVINEIVLTKMPDIKINRIAYDNSAPSGKKIGINGTAESRERLLLFREALENNTAFKTVDLPISNFIKGSNIEFYLSLIPS